MIRELYRFDGTDDLKMQIVATRYPGLHFRFRETDFSQNPAVRISLVLYRATLGTKIKPFYGTGPKSNHFIERLTPHAVLDFG